MRPRSSRTFRRGGRRCARARLRRDGELEGDRGAGLRRDGVGAPALPGCRGRRDRRGARRRRRASGVADEPLGVGEQPRAVREERVRDVVRSRPSPSTAGRPGRPGRASRRTGTRSAAGRRRPGAPRGSPPSGACCRAGARAPRRCRTTRRRPTARWSRRRPTRRGPWSPVALAREHRDPCRMFGTTAATAPSASWSSSRSRSHDVQNDSTSKSVLAVGANACASPVQPRRSSRCGQSVGSDTKLSRCDQATLECRRSRRGSAHSNDERRASALEIGDGRGRHDLGARHLRVLEAVEREGRLERRLAVVREHVPVGRARRAQRLRVDRAVGLEHLGVAHLDAVAGRAADDEPEPARDVLAEVDEGVPVARARSATTIRPPCGRPS